MNMRPNIVAGLDIGSTKTAAVILGVSGDLPRRPTYRVLGVGQARAGGVRRELVTDLEEVTESVRQAMKEAELMAGVSVDQVYAGVAGEHIHGKLSTGVVAASRNEIDASDVRRVHEVARAVVVPADREVIHVLPQGYMIDGRGGIRDPIGMTGMRLEAEIYIITSSATALQNRSRAIHRAGYKIAALVHEPLAAGRAVVVEDERDVGVALVDLGGTSTELAIFRDGRMRHQATIPWGGVTVTNDLAKGLSITYTEAERAKERYGMASAQLVDPREQVEVPGPGPSRERKVPRELIAHIIEQRLDEILGLVAREVESAGETSRLGAGVVLTGGGAALAGAADVAEHVFGMPVRIGFPGEGLAGLTDSVQGSKFATATGLALYGAEQSLESGGFAGGFAEGAMGRIVSWLKEFF
jgi:cell division protein FtsA